MVIVGQIRHLFISFFRKFCIIFNYFVKKYATRDILNKSCEEQCNIYFGRKEMDIVSSFTARLNELMKETGLTPKQISESTGIDLTELMHIRISRLAGADILEFLIDFFRTVCTGSRILQFLAQIGGFFQMFFCVYVGLGK